MFKLDLEKAEEPEIKLPTSARSLIKQESSRKTSTAALLTMPKPLTVWITSNWKTQQWPQDWKRSVFIPIPKKDNAKEWSTYRTIAFVSHTRNVMRKILQVRLQQYVNREFPNVQAAFRKGRGTKVQIANIRWIIEKAREFQENIYFCFIDYAKASVWITAN